MTKDPISEKKVLYIDMDDTICEYKKAYNASLKENPDIAYPQSVPGFFENLDPIEYALSCIAQLEDSGKYDIWIATAPSIKNRHCYTEKANWIFDWLGEEYLEKLIIVADKSKLKGSFLIDDLVEGRGQENFEGELIQYGSTGFKNWIDITVHLL